MSTIAGQPINHRSVPLALRRRWLGTVSAAAIGAVASRLGLSCAQAAQLDLKNLPYIDAHSHVWSPDVERWPLANKQTKDDLKPLSFTPQELLALAEPEGVGRVVLIQHSGYHLWDNSYIVDCAKRLPGRFSLVGMIDDRLPRAGA